jgi:salicylate biosynthesis isochorismate synthase
LTTVRAQSGGPLRLGHSAWALLGERVEAALRRARRERRRVLASVTVPVPADVDLSAALLAARRADDRYFCLEQPDREGFALAALGAAAVVDAHGEERFRSVAGSCRELARGAEVGRDSADPGSPPAAGPVWVGGFAFAPNGGGSPEWSSLAPAQLVMPEVSLARRAGEARMTVTAVVDGDESADAVMERLRARVGSLEPVAMPLLDPSPVEAARVAGAAPPEHFESAVAHAVERIRAGEIEKVVLAREVRVHAPAEIDPAPVFDALRGVFPACYSYLVGTPECAFIGASPELLVRRDGARTQTVALAGTTRRSADPSVDDLLGEQLLRGPKNREEQAIVARRIERTLRPVSLWVAAADEPVLVKVHNVQHLATPIRAQLRDPVPCVELAGMLHPTPAVGGEPRDDAARLIPALEGLDRGWYAGTVGWTDLSEDGEFCVAIRCALLRGSVAHLYAGNGIVRDSDPADELAETEVKLQALLPLLA